MLAWFHPAAAGTSSERVSAWVEEHQHAIVGEFREFLSIPNVAADLPNIRRNAEWLVRRMTAQGIETRLIDFGDAPFVYGERRSAGAERTFLFEGDEEAGSPQMERLVAEHGELLAADAAIIVDGVMTAY